MGSNTVAITDELRVASDAEIRGKLKHANLMVLRGLIYHATGDEVLRTRVKVRKERMGWITNPVIADKTGEEVVLDMAFSLLTAYRDGKRTPPAEVSSERLKTAMALTVDDEVPDDEFEFWSEELAFDLLARRLKWKTPPPTEKLNAFRVIVIGAGVGGINAAVQLKTAGIDFTVFEKNAGVGGVWYQNRYPAARVDSPSRIYSNTFAVNYQFKSPFAPQAENEEFFNWSVDQFALRPNMRFSTEVTRAEWQEADQLWKVTVRKADGAEEVHLANAIISAVGFLDRPITPHIEGAESFKGAQMHTARFDNDLDWSDKRVGLIGTGATGMQIMTGLSKMVKGLTIFQRSPAWSLPMSGYTNTFHEDALWVERNIPYYVNWWRFALTWSVGDHTYSKFIYRDPDWKHPVSINADHHDLYETVLQYLKDKTAGRPDLFEKMLPDYPPLGKRWVLDYGFFDTLKEPHVDLVTDGIDHVSPNGIVTKDGKEHQLDVILYATGFKASDYLWPMEIIGRGGVSLQEVWAKDGARAYWGVTIPKMPNLFLVYGPNTNPTNTGPVQWGEMQVRYALQCLEKIIETGCGSLEVRQGVYNAFNEKLDAELNRMIYINNGAKSYYTNEFGRAATNAPWPTLTYWRNLYHPDFDDYVAGSPKRAEDEAPRRLSAAR